jgi:hypothetical protein
MIKLNFKSQRFLNEVTERPEVWVVTNNQAIQWMRNPKPVSQLSQYAPWRCDRKVIIWSIEDSAADIESIAV